MHIYSSAIKLSRGISLKYHMISIQNVFKIGKKRIAVRNNDTEGLKGNDMLSFLVFTITNQTH